MTSCSDIRLARVKTNSKLVSLNALGTNSGGEGTPTCAELVARRSAQYVHQQANVRNHLAAKELQNKLHVIEDQLLQ